MWKNKGIREQSKTMICWSTLKIRLSLWGVTYYFVAVEFHKERCIVGGHTNTLEWNVLSTNCVTAHDMWSQRHLTSWDSLFVNRDRNSGDTNWIWNQTPNFIPETHRLLESSKPGGNWGSTGFKIQYIAVFIIENN